MTNDARLWPLLVLGTGALLIGLMPLLWLFKRLVRRLGRIEQPPVSGSRYVAALIAIPLCVAMGVAALGLLAALESWRAFTHKTHVAEVQCIEVAPHKLRVYFVPIDRDGARGATEVYDVDGDEWQVGGDILRFRPSFAALGVDTVYRLARVEGRWDRAEDANAHKATAYDRLPPSTTWLSLYRDASHAPLKWMVAGAHGQSVAQLPDRRAVYDLYVTANGYIVDKRSL